MCMISELANALLGYIVKLNAWFENLRGQEQ